MPRKSLKDWLFGPEIYTKAEVQALIEAKERQHIGRFEKELKYMVSELEVLRHRTNRLEAELPKRDAKGHFCKKEYSQADTFA